MTISHLSTRDLAERWNISRRTLDRWRWAGEGPRFLKLGGRVVYRIADIEAFEQQQLRTRTDLPANPTMNLTLYRSESNKNSALVYAQMRGNCIGYDKIR
jgi:predicted DNA-binding transcriptional regulator AlpA